MTFSQIALDVFGVFLAALIGFLLFTVVQALVVGTPSARVTRQLRALHPEAVVFRSVELYTERFNPGGALDEALAALRIPKSASMFTTICTPEGVSLWDNLTAPFTSWAWRELAEWKPTTYTEGRETLQVVYVRSAEEGRTVLTIAIGVPWGLILSWRWRKATAQTTDWFTASISGRV